MSSIQHLFLLRLFFQRKNLNLLEDEIREKKNEKPKKKNKTKKKKKQQQQKQGFMIKPNILPTSRGLGVTC